MKQRELTSTIKLLLKAAEAISKIDSELFHSMADDDCDVVLPQQLLEMAEYLIAYSIKSKYGR